MNPTQSIRVILVEDDEDVRIGNAQALELAGFNVDSFESVEHAEGHLHSGIHGVVLSDVKLPGKSGIAWLHELHALDADLPVILITGHGDISMAVQAIRDGAYDFIAKPYPAEHLVTVVKRAADKRALTLQVRTLRDRLDSLQGIEAILIGGSPQMERVRRSVLALADKSVDVVIYGETGTGKEVVARCLHMHSERRRANFVALNCGALPETLIESELFGHEAGAFTGAKGSRVGKFEFAQGGTLFLDEIEGMPLPVQAKFLRALQERSVERVGSNKSIHSNCRVVAASKEDLKALCEKRAFRSDLYYRLGVAFIELPPLRERRDDIPLLFENFTLAAATRYAMPAPELSRAVLAGLMARSWPGNVRELRNVADRFVLGLPDSVAEDSAAQMEMRSYRLSEQVEAFERMLIADELQRQAGDVAATAKALHIPRQTLYDKLHKMGLVAETYRHPS